MARIRSIKPEFPHSESMGRVSRDARLTFIELWTLADDSGRLRGNSRMLASLLFPYDDDAKDLIEGWLGQLESENCIVRYKVEDTAYLQICNWLNHQKIDKPSQSKLPPFDESSRILSNPLEVSSGDQDQGREWKGVEGKGRDLISVELERSTPVSEPGPVEKIFAHWQQSHRKQRASLDEKRRSLIRKALKHYSEADLCQSITGYLNSPHHMGQNERATVYDSIELFLRDSKHIDDGLKFYAEPPRTDLSAKTRAIVAQTEAWIPPESRHANN